MGKELKSSKKQSVKNADEGKTSGKASKMKKSEKSVAEKSKKIKKDKKSNPSGPDAKGAKKRMTRRFNKLRLKENDLDSGTIVYIGHLPKGFEEDELKKFFG